MTGPDHVVEQRLHADSLLAEAKASTGLSDFGDTKFLLPFRRYLERAVREVHFKPGGVEIFRGEVLRKLINRLRFAEDLRRHPEILQEEVSDPIIILGAARSGTTKLQRMMSAAPDVQKLFMWRLLNPAPFPNAIRGQPDPRMRGGLANSEGFGSEALEDNKGVKAAHVLALGQVEEEILLFDFTFDFSITGESIYVPLFYHRDWARWAGGGETKDSDREAYRYIRSLLQYLQWQDGGKRGRPWIMKYVSHIAHLEPLLECFPKATLVQTHRDPRFSVPSLAKLQGEVWGMCSVVDPKWVGPNMLDWWSEAMNRCLDARERLQLDARILDVPYESVRGSIMPVIRELYRRSGYALTSEAEQAMLQWERENEEGKHGRHEYSLEQFGLTDAEINRAFARYYERFGSMF